MHLEIVPSWDLVGLVNKWRKGQDYPFETDAADEAKVHERGGHDDASIPCIGRRSPAPGWRPRWSSAAVRGRSSPPKMTPADPASAGMFTCRQPASDRESTPVLGKGGS